MSADSSWAVQVALFEALNGDAALNAMVTGVFDHVPQGTAFPYVTLGEMTARPWGTAALDGLEATVVVHVWSRTRGRKEVKQVMAEMHRILHDADLAVGGHALVNLRFDFAEVLREDDGITEHGVVRYRAVTHAA